MRKIEWKYRKKRGNVGKREEMQGKQSGKIGKLSIKVGKREWKDILITIKEKMRGKIREGELE